MAKHLEREIENLKKKVLVLGGKVESRVRDATLAIEERDGMLAQQVIDKDIEIDHMEVEVEEDCLKILALHQPVAIDLRFIISVLKINNDLERIGDLAVNIAERALFLVGQAEINMEFDFITMAQKAQEMLRQSLDSLVNLDSKKAYNVCTDDDTVDAMNRNMYHKVQEGIRAYPEHIETLIHVLSVSRHLERIADHATNIAEDVIYMIAGEIVRHKVEEYKKELPE
jgi:phosphate transport system protein